MSYTPTNWENGKAPALNATNLNKIEQELKKLYDIVSTPDITETTETTMQNSYSGRLLVDEIGGVSEQFTTTGKNLIGTPYSTASKTVNGIAFTVNSDGTVSAKGTATANADFILKGSTNASGSILFDAGTRLVGCPNGGGANTYFLRASDNVNYASTDFGEGKNITEGIRNIYIRVVSGTTVDITFKPMVTTDMTATYDDYEPYTGGIPSPNPSYPQEIKKTVVNEIKTHRKNLFAFGKTAINRTTELRPNYSQRLQMSLVNDNDLNKIKCGFRNGQWTSGYVTIYGIDGTKDYSISYDIEENTTIYTPVVEKHKSECDSTKLTLVISSGNKENIVADTEYFILSNIQVELGTATDYEPYTESVITLSQPIDLYGIGDVQDIITSKDIGRKYCELVFDGSDDEGWSTSSALSGRYMVVKNDGKGYGKILCTHAKNVNNSSEVNECCINSAKYFFINTSFATLAEWKAHLAEKPMTVVYELAEEATEALPIADQIALNSLQTYDGITHLEFDSEIKPTFKGEYGTSKVGGYTLEALLTARSK